MRDALALICSVEQEAAPLLERMVGRSAMEIGRRPVHEGSLQDTPVAVVIGGMGKTNAAQALTALLEHRRVRAIVGFGVAGAYERSGLAVGGLALASSEIYADEGVETPDGWISTREIGIPLAASGARELFNDFPVDPALLRGAVDALREAGVSHAVGPFATVSCCSGTALRGTLISGRTGSICETMEGAAYAHVAALYETPFLEVRGISNLVEDRDTSAWRIPLAARAAADAAWLIVTALRTS